VLCVYYNITKIYFVCSVGKPEKIHKPRRSPLDRKQLADRHETDKEVTLPEPKPNIGTIAGYEITQSPVLENNAKPINIRDISLPNKWNWVEGQSICGKFEHIGPKFLMTKMVQIRDRTINYFVNGKTVVHATLQTEFETVNDLNNAVDLFDSAIGCSGCTDETLLSAQLKGFGNQKSLRSNNCLLISFSSNCCSECMAMCRELEKKMKRQRIKVNGPKRLTVTRKVSTSL
jgi:hypothetical protein